MWKPEPEDPCYTIKIAADLLKLHPQTIRNYEKLGLIKPGRTEGNVRLFSSKDLERLKRVAVFRNMGINLPGIEVILNLLEQMDELKEIINDMMKKNEKDVSFSFFTDEHNDDMDS